MTKAAWAAMLVLLLGLSGCFGGGKAGDDKGGDGQGDGSPSSGTGPAGSTASTTKSGTGQAIGTSTPTGTSGVGTKGPAGSTSASVARSPDVWFNGSRMDLAFKGNGAVLDVLFEATVGFTIHAAVATQDPTVFLAMVPEAPTSATCGVGADGPLVASGHPWLDSMGTGERAAGRYRFVYQMPSSATVGLILGDVTLNNMPVEVHGKATNATIEVREAHWSGTPVNGLTGAVDGFFAAGRIVVAAGSRMDYDAAAGELRAGNDLDAGSADCAKGERVVPVEQGVGALLAGSIENSIAAIMRDADLFWQGSLSGAFASPAPSGGLVVVHLND